MPDNDNIPKHLELELKFQKHKAVTPNTKHRAQMDKFRNNYMDKKTIRDHKDGAEKFLFDMGVEEGFQSESDRDGLEQNQRYRHEQLRKTSWKEAKIYYKTNYSLEKKFNEKSKGKG